MKRVRWCNEGYWDEEMCFDGGATDGIISDIEIESSDSLYNLTGLDPSHSFSRWMRRPAPVHPHFGVE